MATAKMAILYSGAETPDDLTRFYIVAQTAIGVFTMPASTDLVQVTTGLPINAVAEQLERATKVAGSYVMPGTVSGRYDHVDIDIPVEPTFPGVLSGTSKPNIHGLIAAHTNVTPVVVNGQSAINIVNVIAHTAALTQVEVAGVVGDWPATPFGAYLRSNNSASAHGANEGRICRIKAAGGAGVYLTFECGFTARPVTTGTPDTIHGGYSYSYALSGWDTWNSIHVEDGNSAYDCLNCRVPGMSSGIDGRGIHMTTFKAGVARVYPTNLDWIKGAAGVDSFTSTALTFDVTDSRKNSTAKYADLVKYSTATGQETARETNAEFATYTAAERTNGTRVFLNRGATPVSATDLQTVTTLTQERNGTYDTSGVLPNVLYLSVDNRQEIRVTLTRSATLAAATAVADINAALTASEFYGVNKAGFILTSWEAVASVTGTAVRLTSKAWGFESRIVVRNGGADSAHAVIFNAAFDIRAADAVQIEYHALGGSDTNTVALNPLGRAFFGGYQLPWKNCEVSVDAQVEWNEDTKYGGLYPYGAKHGKSRKIDIGIDMPAHEFVNRWRDMAEQQEGMVFNCDVGNTLGKVLSFGVLKAVPSASVMGDGTIRQAQFSLVPFDPGSSQCEMVWFFG